MADRLDVTAGALVEVVNASSRKGDPKPTFLVGQVLRVHYITADKTSLCVVGHDGLWKAGRFKLPNP